MVPLTFRQSAYKRGSQNTEWVRGINASTAAIAVSSTGLAPLYRNFYHRMVRIEASRYDELTDKNQRITHKNARKRSTRLALMPNG